MRSSRLTPASRTKTALELILGLFLCFGYIWFLLPLYRSWLHILWIIIFLGFLFWSRHYHKEGWQDLGLTRRNWVHSAKVLLPVTFAGVLVLSVVWATIHPINLDFYRQADFWFGLVEYALWALFQQYIFLAFFFRRLKEFFFPHPFPAILFSAVFFSAVHIPNAPLMILCFLGGLFWAWAYYKYSNLLTISLSQAVFGVFCSKVLLIYMIVGPYADVDRWTKQYLTLCIIDTVNGIEVAGVKKPPLEISKEDKEIIIQGWIVGVEEKIEGVAARMEGKDYPVCYGMARKDVAEYYKKPDYLYSGFRAIIPLAGIDPGLHAIRLKVSLKDRAFTHYPGRDGLWVRLR